MTAIIRLTDSNHKMNNKTVTLKTIFGNFRTAKNNVRYINDNVVAIPFDVFTRNGFNPCQLVNGFVETDRG